MLKESEMGFKNFDKENNIDADNLSKQGKKVEKLYNHYKGMSEDELVSELFKYVSKEKENGTFDYDALCNMLEKISPFLSDEQKLKMKQIMENLK